MHSTPPLRRVTDGQIDGQRDSLRQHSLRYAYASRGKIDGIGSVMVQLNLPGGSTLQCELTVLIDSCLYVNIVTFMSEVKSEYRNL